MDVLHRAPHEEPQWRQDTPAHGQPSGRQRPAGQLRRGRSTARASVFAKASGLPTPDAVAPPHGWRTAPPAKDTRVKALVVAGDKVLTATQPGGTRYGQKNVQKGELWILSATDGTTLSRVSLGTIPRFDGLAATPDRIYLATDAGQVIAFEAK